MKIWYSEEIAQGLLALNEADLAPFPGTDLFTRGPPGRAPDFHRVWSKCCYPKISMKDPGIAPRWSVCTRSTTHMPMPCQQHRSLRSPKPQQAATKYVGLSRSAYRCVSTTAKCVRAAVTALTIIIIQHREGIHSCGLCPFPST